jgi:hypothetical protein
MARSQGEKQALIAFLQNLVLFKLEEEAQPAIRPSALPAVGDAENTRLRSST